MPSFFGVSLTKIIRHSDSMQERSAPYPPTGASLTRATEVLGTLTEDQVLAIWKAITLIGEADECHETTDRSEILADAETVLIAVLSNLGPDAENNGNVYAFPVRVITQ